jgi:hypothetical protein
MAAPGVFTEGDIAEVKQFCLANNNQLGVNILHMTVHTPVAGFAQANLAKAWGGLVSAGLRLMMPNTAQYYGTGVKNLSQVPNPAPSFSTQGQGPGLDGAVLLPTQTCGLITLRTPYAGRAYRGRVYVAFPSAIENVSLDVPSAAYIAAITGFATTLAEDQILTDGLTSATVRVGIFHRPPKGQTPTPSSITTVTSGTAAHIWATQRRRGEYGRKNLPPF